MDPKVAAALALLANDPAAKAALLSALGAAQSPALPVASGTQPSLPPTHQAHNVRCRACGRFEWIPLDASPDAVPVWTESTAKPALAFEPIKQV